MTLLVAMITLVVLMLLGVGAMVASNTMFKLAGNLQFANEAKNRAENAINIAEDWLMTGANAQNGGFSASSAPYYDASTPINAFTYNWSAASAPTADSRFVIQRITISKICEPGNSACFDPAPVSPPNYFHIYRIIARGTSVRGATRYVESVVQIPCVAPACN